MAEVKISPDELKRQATRMTALQEQYEILFRSVTAELKVMNQNWSPFLANNFSGKIDSAQKGFSAVERILEIGAAAALQSANTMESIDRALAKTMETGGVSLAGKHKSVSKIKQGGQHRTVKKGAVGRASWFEQVGKAVCKKASKVKSAVKKGIKKVTDSYYSHGTAYKIIEYGKCALKAAKGVAKVVAGVGTILGSAGGATPVAVLSIISGCNDIYNCMMDGANIYTAQYDKVGKTNGLKDTMSKNMGDFVEAIGGDHELGEKIGKGVYYGIDIVTTVAAFDPQKSDSLTNQLKDAKKIDFTKVKQEFDQIGQAVKTTGVKNLLFSDIETLKYNSKLASYAFQETGNLIKNTKLLYKVGAKTVEFADVVVDDVLSLDSKELSTLKDITKVFGKVGKVTGKAKKIMKYIN